jgi:hypothetical protein
MRTLILDPGKATQKTLRNITASIIAGCTSRSGRRIRIKTCIFFLSSEIQHVGKAAEFGALFEAPSRQVSASLAPAKLFWRFSLSEALRTAVQHRLQSRQWTYAIPTASSARKIGVSVPSVRT